MQVLAYVNPLQFASDVYTCTMQDIKRAYVVLIVLRVLYNITSVHSSISARACVYNPPHNYVYTYKNYAYDNKWSATINKYCYNNNCSKYVSGEGFFMHIFEVNHSRV